MTALVDVSSLLKMLPSVTVPTSSTPASSCAVNITLDSNNRTNLQSKIGDNYCIAVNFPSGSKHVIDTVLTKLSGVTSQFDSTGNLMILVKPTTTGQFSMKIGMSSSSGSVSYATVAITIGAKSNFAPVFGSNSNRTIMWLIAGLTVVIVLWVMLRKKGKRGKRSRIYF